MNSDKSTLQSSGGNILLRIAIVTVLVLLCSAPLAAAVTERTSGLDEAVNFLKQ
jgi:hypothetical protein